MNDVKKKAVLLIISIVLLVSVLLYMSYAWYTKMTSVAGLTFKTAKWDVSANHQVEDFKVNVFEYDTLGEGRYAAPGVWGVIPISVSSSSSNTDVAFTVTVDKSTMSQEFQDRMYFYYYTGTQEIDGTTLPDKNFLTELKAEGADRTVLEDTIDFGSSTTAFIFWHWIYDYDEYIEIQDEVMGRGRTDYTKEKDAVDILNSLYRDNPSNLEILYDTQTVDVALKQSNILPYQTYYYKLATPQYVLYNNAQWESETVKPILYETVVGGGYTQFTGTFSPTGTYYIYQEYDVYDISMGSIQVYELVQGEYNPTTLRKENELFSRTVLNATTHKVEVQYYALSTAQVKILRDYRSQMLSDATQNYTSDKFFEDYYNRYCSKRDTFDAFDTQVGLNPQLYAPQMNATVMVTGEQVEPSQT